MEYKHMFDIDLSEEPILKKFHECEGEFGFYRINQTASPPYVEWRKKPFPTLSFSSLTSSTESLDRVHLVMGVHDRFEHTSVLPRLRRLVLLLRHYFKKWTPPRRLM